MPKFTLFSQQIWSTSALLHCYVIVHVTGRGCFLNIIMFILYLTILYFVLKIKNGLNKRNREQYLFFRCKCFQIIKKSEDAHRKYRTLKRPNYWSIWTETPKPCVHGWASSLKNLYQCCSSVHCGWRQKEVGNKLFFPTTLFYQSFSHGIVPRGGCFELGEKCQNAMVSPFTHHRNSVPVEKLQVISIDIPLRKQKHPGPR